MENVPGREDITVSAFFVADHAEALNGKLYVMGGCWDTLFVSQLPVQHPHLSVCAVLHVPYATTEEQHSVEVRVVDQDGQPIVPGATGGFRAGRRPGMEQHEDTTVVLVVNLLNLPLSSLGPLLFDFVVDGSPLAQTRVKVVQNPQRPG